MLIFLSLLFLSFLIAENRYISTSYNRTRWTRGYVRFYLVGTPDVNFNPNLYKNSDSKNEENLVAGDKIFFGTDDGGKRFDETSKYNDFKSNTISKDNLGSAEKEPSGFHIEESGSEGFRIPNNSATDDANAEDRKIQTIVGISSDKGTETSPEQNLRTRLRTQYEATNEATKENYNTKYRDHEEVRGTEESFRTGTKESGNISVIEEPSSGFSDLEYSSRKDFATESQPYPPPLFVTQEKNLTVTDKSLNFSNIGSQNITTNNFLPGFSDTETSGDDYFDTKSIGDEDFISGSGSDDSFDAPSVTPEKETTITTKSSTFRDMKFSGQDELGSGSENTYSMNATPYYKISTIANWAFSFSDTEYSGSDELGSGSGDSLASDKKATETDSSFSFFDLEHSDFEGSGSGSHESNSIYKAYTQQYRYTTQSYDVESDDGSGTGAFQVDTTSEAPVTYADFYFDHRVQKERKDSMSEEKKDYMPDEKYKRYDVEQLIKNILESPYYEKKLTYLGAHEDYYVILDDLTEMEP